MSERQLEKFVDAELICTTVLLPEFMTHCVAISNPNNQPVADTLAKLCSSLENKKYYKFWLVGPEAALNALNNEFKINAVMNRYTWYDEAIIPAGEKSKVAAYNLNQQVNKEHDCVVRTFMLKQEERIQLFRTMNYEDYRGTLVEQLPT